MNIDWSKAPEWADGHALVAHQGITEVWASADHYAVVGRAGGPYPYGGGAGETRHNHTRGALQYITRRPDRWNGEGLPPVGTVCEFSGFNPEETLPTDPRVGDQVTVIAHFMSGSFEVAAFTFYAPPEFEYLQVAQGAYGCFRPIRTPEQIAAEEREKAIKEMIDECPYPGSECTRIDCQALYEAGYRKQVTP